MENFRDALTDCSLSDLGYTGVWYTWQKGRLSSSNIRERLDRGVASKDWFDLFPEFKLQHRTHTFSDHCPLLLDTKPNNQNRRHWPFQFEASWLMETSCEAEVRKIWENSTGHVLDKLNSIKIGLENWYNRIKKEKKLTVNDLKKRLADLANMDPIDDILQETLEAQISLNLEMDREEVYWEQRARTNWLKNGDMNTTFFHKSASQRRKTNRVQKLYNNQGALIEDEHEMSTVATNYFKDLFHSQGSSSMDTILQGINCCISPEMNSDLEKNFEEKKILHAIKSMSPLKACGEDGLGAIFYQRFWNIIGRDITNFCLATLRGEEIISRINHTHIALIPKIKDPSSMSNFRPISLCNVLYKIIAKVIANRFQKVLHLCVDEAQSAFIPGRLISDNIVAAYETLHSMKNRRMGRKGYFALKLDMSKAYDRVEWNFLTAVMYKMGFSNSWIMRIFNCISSVSYSVILNGSIGEKFAPTRGLRQGDPLSPYLFLICSEGLSSLLRLSSQNDSMLGIKIARGAPTISHLLFADDCLIFGDASATGATIIKQILLDYAAASGQLVNYDKSGVFFSSNVIDSNKADVQHILGVSLTTNLEKYLGLPAIIGRCKKAAFSNLKDRFNFYTEGWSSKFLSAGGKEVFIKSVLQSIPMYAMSCFLLPKSFCRELEAIAAKFWWQKSKEKRGIHWCDWSFLRKLKDSGGMGFRDLRKFNIALLAKQGWRLMSNPSSLVSRLLKAKYYKETNFLGSNLGNRPSFIWKSIWCAKGLLSLGLNWRIGSGSKVSIWDDPWLPVKENPRITSPRTDTVKTVSDLIQTDNMWDENLVNSVFNQRDADAILSITLPYSKEDDFQIWAEEPSGIYTVRSGYKKLLTQDNNNTAEYIFKAIWQVPCPSKIKICVWKFIHGFLPTRQNLCFRKITQNASCLRCNTSIESTEHIIRDCQFAYDIWRNLGITWPTHLNTVNFKEWLTWILMHHSKHTHRKIAITIWAIWYSRNKLYH
ncbi:hypothetical protein HRI_002007400 [Hibiscus trionum]|uniref:Reverse transcriptase domain-containing protein n=1 Tax=Hibiscus trionum TaxID=183268 RepID=A0A9W7HUJ5_HIBTR|nr:hypothetical protein HRI_002007400 [Hibiscus trionum]